MFHVFLSVFQLIGTAICGIGLWAWTEKDMFTNIGRLTNVALDPALLFIMIGGVMFIIGFAGCVGALRENTKLLMFVSTGSLVKNLVLFSVAVININFSLLLAKLLTDMYSTL